jgi:ABC-type antimicrobial peptide transport system permease subunit
MVDISRIVYNYTVITEHSNYQGEKIPLGRGEIIVSIDQYNKIFNSNYGLSDFYNGGLVIKVPEHIGEKINFCVKDEDSNALIDIKDAVIKGVSFNEGLYFGSSNDYYRTKYYENPKYYEIYLNEEDYQDNIVKLPLFLSEIMLTAPENADSAYGYFDFAESRGLEVFSTYYWMLSNQELNPSEEPIVLLIISGLLFVMLLAVCLIKAVSRRRARDFSLLKSLGTDVSELIRIFFLESLVLALLICLLSLPLLPLVEWYDAYTNNEDFVYGVKTVVFDYYTYLLILVVPALTVLLASLLTLRKILKVKPDQFIKELPPEIPEMPRYNSSFIN